MNKKWWLVIGIIIVLIASSAFLVYLNIDKKSDIESKKNNIESLQKKNKDLKNDLKQANKEKKLLKNNKEQETSEIDQPKENTFEEDVTWLVKKIYESMDRKKLHDDIRASITDDLEESLFGEGEIDEKETDKKPSIQKSVHQLNFYGKYDKEDKYEAVATFNLEIEAPKVTEHHFVIVKMTIKKKQDEWRFSEFEELASRNKRDDD